MIRDKIEKIVHNEIVSYIFWGATTTLVNLALYTILCYIVEYWIANIIAIIIGKLYAYFVNKLFVFKSKCGSLKDLIKEIISYIMTRGFSGLIDFFGVIILVEGLAFGEKFAKYFVTVIDILLNYILGKKVVFVNNKKRGE